LRRVVTSVLEDGPFDPRRPPALVRDMVSYGPSDGSDPCFAEIFKREDPLAVRCLQAMTTRSVGAARILLARLVFYLVEGFPGLLDSLVCRIVSNPVYLRA